MFDGFTVVVDVLDELGVIHESPRSTVSQQEEQDLMEALALSLSLTSLQPPNHEEERPAPVRPVQRKAPPPAPPVDSPPRPPVVEPTAQQRFNSSVIRRLPTVFPPVGHAWNHSPLARAMRPPPMVFRPWAQRKESLAYFPASNRWYGPARRIRPHRVTPKSAAASSSSSCRRCAPIPEPTEDVDESEEDRHSEATSTVSTAPSYHRPMPDLE